MSEDHKQACKKALDAIQHLYVEINRITLDAHLLGELYKVRM